MNVGILFLKNENNLIHQFFDNITNIANSKIEFVGGSAEGYDENVVGVIVVDKLVIEYDEEKQTNYLEDTKGNKYFAYEDTLPEGLVDLSEKFKKPTVEELQNKTIILSEENATLKQELANTNAMLLEFMENNLV